MKKAIVFLVLVSLLFTSGCEKESEYKKEMAGRTFSSYQGAIVFEEDEIFVYLYTYLSRFSDEEREQEIERMRESKEIIGELDEAYNEKIISKNPRIEDGVIKSDSLEDLKIDENGHIVYRGIDFVEKFR
ncbi:hypothetical protein [Peptoniphilus sp.]|uniref:hypothetical protein n=1 Tax=Peptoniphilus sp. TaxID=1971214 RepID=UPI003994C004